MKQLTNKAPTANSKGLRFGNFVQGREVIEEEMEAVFAGKKDAKTALDDAVKRGNEVLRKFQAPPVAELGFATLDTHRALRKGFPEVIFGAGKTPAQVVGIAGKLLEREQNVLVTRINGEHAKALKKKFKRAVHHELARCVTIENKPLPKRPGTIAVVCAGALVNPPMPSTTSGRNSSHTAAQPRVAPAKRQQKRINWRGPV